MWISYQAILRTCTRHIVSAVAWSRDENIASKLYHASFAPSMSNVPIALHGAWFINGSLTSSEKNKAPKNYMLRMSCSLVYLQPNE